MEDKFKDISIDKDTAILFEEQMKFGKEDIVYQKWIFDGIVGESIIFYAKDVEYLGEDELKQYVNDSGLVNANSSITISKNDVKYTFVNFNFQA